MSFKSTLTNTVNELRKVNIEDSNVPEKYLKSLYKRARKHLFQYGMKQAEDLHKNIWDFEYDCYYFNENFETPYSEFELNIGDLFEFFLVLKKRLYSNAQV